MLWSRRKSSSGPRWCSGRISSRSNSTYDTLRTPRGKAAPRDEARDPGHRLARPLGHHGERQLAVVVVEDLEAVVPPIAHFVQGTDHFRDLRAVHALAGKNAVVPRGFDAVVGGADLLPHEIGQLHQEHLGGFDLLQRVEAGFVGEGWET